MLKLFLSLSALMSSSAAAELPMDQPERAYSECLALAEAAPNQAFEQGGAWRDLGGGYRARHCIARALVTLGELEVGASRLEEVAEESGIPVRLRAALLEEAADAWLEAGMPEQAYADLSGALDIVSRDPLLWIKRAQALAAAENYWRAIDDLNNALDLDSSSETALAMRASAYRHVGEDGLALDDANRALSFAPTFVPALLERGNIQRLLGNDPAARADWLAVLQLDEEGPAADAARANIERLDGPFPTD